MLKREVQEMAILRRRINPAQSSVFGPATKIKTPQDLRALIDDRGICVVPLDVERLVDALGIRLVREPMDDDRSGYVQRRRFGWVIGVNSLQHPRRQRFTIAHELAHYVLHRSEKNDFQDRTFFRGAVVDPMEREANRFAGELLMPEIEFRSAVDSGVRDLSKLADRFGASTLAIQVRAEQLGYKVSRQR